MCKHKLTTLLSSFATKTLFLYPNKSQLFLLVSTFLARHRQAQVTLRVLRLSQANQATRRRRRHHCHSRNCY